MPDDTPAEDMKPAAPESGVKLSAPKGFAPPKGIQPGESFDAVATLRQTESGLELLAIDGAPVGDEKEMPGEPPEEEQREMPSRPMDSAEGVRMPWDEQ